MIAASRSGGPRIVRSPDRARWLLRLGVDEADDVDAIFGVTQQLLGDRLADVSGADDDSVLNEARPCAGSCACEGPGQRHQQDRENPEEQEFRHVRVREPCKRCESVEEPRANRDHVEHGRGLIDSGVSRAPVVLAVQPIEPRDQYPSRQREQEEERLRSEVEAPGKPPVEGELGGEEGDEKCRHVGAEQKAPHHPSATVDTRREASPLENLERPLADDILERLPFGQRPRERPFAHPGEALSQTAVPLPRSVTAP